MAGLPIEMLRLSVDIEMAVSRLYQLFSERFSEDFDFWWRLGMEEVNHASLIRTGEKIPERMFPRELLVRDLGALRKILDSVNAKIEECEKEELTREEAFRAALELESGASEQHYQMFMKADLPDRIAQIYQELNAGDLDHKKRIEEYLAKIGVKS